MSLNPGLPPINLNTPPKGSSNSSGGSQQPAGISASVSSSSGRDVCCICLNPLVDTKKPASDQKAIVTFGCAHKIHFLCVEQLKQNAKVNLDCPLCRQQTHGVMRYSASSSLSQSPFVQRSPVNFTPLSPPLYSPAAYQSPSTPQPAIRQPFNDDMPVPAVTIERSPLLLQCIPGLTQQNLNGQLPTFDGIVKLKAQIEAQDTITPADFVVVADTSGSMKGDKISQLKMTMQWMINTLNERHRMSIITFSDQAVRQTPLMLMNAAGKLHQASVLQRIHASGGTDISSALSLASAVVNERVHALSATVVVLITDGQDNNRDTMMGSAAAAIAAIAPKAMLACIGLGADHDSALLSTLSRRAHGSFEYCADSNSIAPTIGGITGAAMKAVAMGLKILIECSEGNKEIHIPLFSEGQEHCSTFTARTNSNPYLKASATYTIPGTNQAKTLILESSINPASPSLADHATLVLINSHKNRELAGEALLRSADLAATISDYEGARRILADAIRTMQTSISAQEPICIQLIADCEAALQKLEDPESYATQGGAAQALSAGVSHSSQAPSSQSAPLYATPSITHSALAARRYVSSTQDTDPNAGSRTASVNSGKKSDKKRPNGT